MPGSAMEPRLALVIDDDTGVAEVYAEALRQAGWRGALAIQSRPLPRAELVLDEVRALYPGLQVSLADCAG